MAWWLLRTRQLLSPATTRSLLLSHPAMITIGIGRLRTEPGHTNLAIPKPRTWTLRATRLPIQKPQTGPIQALITPSSVATTMYLQMVFVPDLRTIFGEVR